MRKYDLVIFDLDGTLLDTGEGIVEAVRHTIDRFGLTPLEDEELKRGFIGPPIQEGFAKRYGLEGDILQDIATVFRDYYSTKSLLGARIYDGLEELLQKLLGMGVKPAVATYKREDYALTLLCAFGFDKYTDIMFGGDHTNILKKKDIIEKCIAKAGVTDLSRVVMIGDTDGDRKGAELVGIDFIGVTYGFGYKTARDVMSGYAVGSADTPLEILNFI